MNPGLVVKLRPAGPWRSGPDSGARNRVDPIYHSDSVYAAVTAALSTLGRRDEWLDATARNPQGPAVRFSSCFPFLGEFDFIVPPRSIWPPSAGTPAQIDLLEPMGLGTVIHLNLAGQIDGHHVTMTLRRLDLDTLPLRRSGFHWVQEFPDLPPDE